ncbi:hypothetical protein [Herbaspirillum huttiense]|uniref:hypothetical protein n=1 Tax=Herbaspirillum huttiense TaxID=863372 RepID=UPI0039B05586
MAKKLACSTALMVPAADERIACLPGFQFFVCCAGSAGCLHPFIQHVPVRFAL